MRSQQKLAARVAVVALVAGGLGVGGATTARADAFGRTFWRSGTKIEVPAESVSVKGVSIATPPATITLPAGRFDFTVRGSALNVTEFRSSVTTLLHMSPERWQVKYSFMKDNSQKQEEEYAWVWGEEHFTTLPWGDDVVTAPPGGWTAKDRGSVVAQLYVRGAPVPGARVRHQLSLLPGFRNRLNEVPYEAGRLVGKGINEAEYAAREAARAAEKAKRFVNRFNPFD